MLITVAIHTMRHGAEANAASCFMSEGVDAMYVVWWWKVLESGVRGVLHENSQTLARRVGQQAQ